MFSIEVWGAGELGACLSRPIGLVERGAETPEGMVQVREVCLVRPEEGG